MFTVRLCASVAAAGALMGAMRVWIDKQRAHATAVHFNDATDGVEIEISFDKEHDAAACAEHFEGLLLVTG
jgi:hypothetical protein